MGTHGARLGVLIGVLLISGVLVACSGDESTTSVPPMTQPDTSPVVVPTTDGVATTTTPATTTSTSVVAVYPTTTAHRVPATCDDELDEMLAAVDSSMLGARLPVDGDWTLETAANAFEARTQTAEEFRYRVGLDCTVRMAKWSTSGESLVVGAWTGERRAYVVQSTAAPSTPYEQSIRFQLFIDQPLGEWIDNQQVWAGSLADGDSILVGTADTSTGLTAKSWWNEVPRFEDLPVTIDAERHAIDALLQAGARNVSVAEPARVGSQLAAVQFITPRGLILVATVGPTGWFDPAAAIVEGEMTVEEIAGVDVHVTRAVAESYAVGSVGWSCGDHVWFIDSVYGTIDELIEWTGNLIEATGC